MSILRQDGNQWSLRQPWPRNIEGEDTVEEVIEKQDDGSAPDSLLVSCLPEQYDSPPPYWISVAKSGFRRLHRWKGCRVEPKECFSWKPVRELVAVGDQGIADKACKLCWPAEESTPLPAQTSEEDSSSGSSTESSDSSSCEVITD
jgi:hypothetical protein